MDEIEASDLRKRLDAIAEHILEIKSSMYTREDYTRDSARIYDQMSINQAAINTAVRDALAIMERQVAAIRDDVTKSLQETVPREELKARWDYDDRRNDALTLRVANLELEARHLATSLEDAKKPKLPMWLIVAGTAVSSAIITAFANAAVGSLHFTWGAIHP